MRVKFVDPVGYRGSIAPRRARTRDTQQHTHVSVHDAKVTPSMPRVDPARPRLGEEPEDAGFCDQATAMCGFRRDRDGVWRGRDRSGRNWRIEANGPLLYLYPDDDDDGTDDEDLGLRAPLGSERTDLAPVAGGGVVNPIDPRPADRRRAGDRVLATPGVDHGPDQIEGLRSWQARLNRFWAR
jgi:hypothetical protein